MYINWVKSTTKHTKVGLDKMIDSKGRLTASSYLICHKEICETAMYESLVI